VRKKTWHRKNEYTGTGIPGYWSHAWTFGPDSFFFSSVCSSVDPGRICPDLHGGFLFAGKILMPVSGASFCQRDPAFSLYNFFPLPSVKKTGMAVSGHIITTIAIIIGSVDPCLFYPQRISIVEDRANPVNMLYYSRYTV
jgi:hypothetical protein